MAPPSASVPWASRAHTVSEGSIPAAQTGKQGTKTPAGREGAPQPSHPSSPSPLGLQAASHPTSHTFHSAFPPVSMSLVLAPPPYFPDLPSTVPVCLLSSPCRNRATCQDGPQGPRCLCPTGYTGSSCQVRVTEPHVLRREGLESSSKRVSGTKSGQWGRLGEAST